MARRFASSSNANHWLQPLNTQYIISHGVKIKLSFFFFCPLRRTMRALLRSVSFSFFFSPFLFIISSPPRGIFFFCRSRNFIHTYANEWIDGMADKWCDAFWWRCTNKNQPLVRFCVGFCITVTFISRGLLAERMYEPPDKWTHSIRINYVFAQKSSTNIDLWSPRRAHVRSALH